MWRLVRSEKPCFLALLVPSWKIVEHFVGQLVDLVDDLNTRNSWLILWKDLRKEITSWSCTWSEQNKGWLILLRIWTQENDLTILETAGWSCPWSEHKKEFDDLVYNPNQKSRYRIQLRLLMNITREPAGWSYRHCLQLVDLVDI
jgi:hypothetical protein